MSKIIGTKAYAHKHYVHTLPRWADNSISILEGRIGTIFGTRWTDWRRWNVVKTSRGYLSKKGVLKPARVSLLYYDKFDEVEHPELRRSMSYNLADGGPPTFSDYTGWDNPYILHRKELLVDETHPEHWRWSQLTAMEEDAGLLSLPGIGNKLGWEAQLKQHGYRILFYALVSEMENGINISK